MIVPTSRLLFWVAVIVLPFALVVALVPAMMMISLLFIGVLFLISAADAAGAKTGLAGISLELPAIVRMSKDREAKLEIRIRNEKQTVKKLRFGLAWPREIKSADEEMETLLPAQSEWSKLTWPCVPLKRGNYRLDWAFVEISSPLGLWVARKKAPVNSELRVYPNLLGE